MKYQFEWVGIDSCWLCPMLDLEKIECCINRKIGYIIPMGEKPYWCPLVEVQDEN